MAQPETFQAALFDWIHTQTGGHSLMVIPRLFVDLTGDLTTAAFLAQLVYWTGRGIRPDGFIWKSRREWAEETGLSDYAIRKAAAWLKQEGLVEIELHRAYGAPTNHYRLNQVPLMERLSQLVETDRSIRCIPKDELLESPHPFGWNRPNPNRDYPRKNQRKTTPEGAPHSGALGEEYRQQLISGEYEGVVET